MTVGPIHHVAIVVRSIDESLPRYRSLFGLTPEVEPFEFTAQRVRLCFLPTGPAPAARLELVEPIDDDSGVARFLSTRGEGLHHVCFATDDLPASLDALAAHEAELIDRQPRAGAHGTVAFVHPRTLDGVLWELLQAAPPAERDWQREGAELGAVERNDVLLPAVRALEYSAAYTVEGWAAWTILYAIDIGGDISVVRFGGDGPVPEALPDDFALIRDLLAFPGGS